MVLESLCTLIVFFLLLIWLNEGRLAIWAAGVVFVLYVAITEYARARLVPLYVKSSPK